MPRLRRSAVGGLIYHVLNRGNDRKQIFFKPADYLAFFMLMLEGLKHAQVEVLAYCLMPNHWHLVLQPKGDQDLSRYLSWITNTHAKRYREHYNTRGHGHVYQGRFKSFAVQQDHHLLVVLRYVESNALRAGLVQRAEDWPWSSAAAFPPPHARELLSPWPIARPPDWLELINQLPPTAELQEMRVSVNRQRPFGAKEWIAQMRPSACAPPSD